MELPIKRRRPPPSSSSISICSLPNDLTSEIFLKLPLKSIGRFRCVSKLWYSITTSPYFINSFTSRSPTQPRLLLCLKEDYKLFVLSVPQNDQSRNDSYASSVPIECYHVESPVKLEHYNPTESVHGLICFQASTELMVCNPSTRTLLTLPKPEMSWKSMGMILGYDPVESKHKLVCFTQGECRVLTLGSAQKTWRTVKTNHSHDDCKHGPCINGVVYYKFFDQMLVYNIMSFDVRFEKFNMIELPQDYKGGILINYEGKLASANSNSDGGINLCILEDAKKPEWSYKYFSALQVHNDQSLKTDCKIKGITDAGEFIYAPSILPEPLYILYFDPKRNSLRQVKIEGTEHGKFMLSHGLVDLMNMNCYKYIPNHIESLMSFKDL